MDVCINLRLHLIVCFHEYLGVHVCVVQSIHRLTDCFAAAIQSECWLHDSRVIAIVTQLWCDSVFLSTKLKYSKQHGVTGKHWFTSCDSHWPIQYLTAVCFFAPQGTTEIDCDKEGRQHLGYAKEGFEGRFQKPCLKLDLIIFPILMYSWNFSKLSWSRLLT